MIKFLPREGGVPLSTYFLDQTTIEAAVEYFRETELTSKSVTNNRSSGTLDMYWILKRCGVSPSRDILATDEIVKKEAGRSLWAFAGLFSADENAGKYSLMFPDKISENKYNNPGTPFGKVAGRTFDTVRNQSPAIFEKKGAVISLDPEYDTKISNDVLRGRKFSLFYFSAWIYRFTGFSVDAEEVSDRDIQRIISKSIVSFLRLDKADLSMFFEDDFSQHVMGFSQSPITGKLLREIVFPDSNYPDGHAPEILEGQADDDALLSISPTSDQISRYVLPNGDNPSIDQITRTLELKKQAILTGVPGTGKSRFIDQIADDKNRFQKTTLIQFHPSFTYEDFIGGETLLNGNVVTKPGVLFSAIQDAQQHPEEKHLFVIDEINRGNIAEIFGETIQILDRKGYYAFLPNPINGVDRISLPDNLYILGAMNSSDRSTAILDLAIRRRFAFIELQPNYEVVSDEVEFDGVDMGKFLQTINARILRALDDPSKLLGQGYVYPQSVVDGHWQWSDEDFHMQFNYVILPTLQEYAQDNTSILAAIVGSALSNVILDLGEFKNAFHREFG